MARDEDIGDMKARINALEKAVAQLLTDRDRMFGILDEIRQTLAVAVHRLNALGDEAHAYLKRCDACRDDISDLKAKTSRGTTSGFKRAMAINPWNKPIGQLAGEIFVKALQLVGVGIVVALIVIGAGAMS